MGHGKRYPVGFSTKIHWRCEGGGKPVTFVFTVRERNEAVVFETPKIWRLCVLYLFLKFSFTDSL
jgi:hypothetical protein